MFKPPLLLTLSYLVSVAAYQVGLGFLLGQRVRSVEPAAPTLWAHGALIGAGSFGVATYWVMMRRTPRTLQAAWFYLGGAISAGLFLESLALLNVDYYMTRTFYLISPTAAIVFAGLIAMHMSLRYFETNRPLSGRLTTVVLSLIFAGSSIGLRPFYLRDALIDAVAVQFFSANAIVCGLLIYRLFGVWLSRDQAPTIGSGHAQRV